MTIKRYLITGATGYTGSFLAKDIVNKNIAEVHLIVRRNSDLNKLKEIKDKVFIHIHNGTIENMIEILNQSKPDIVFHLASLVLSSHEPKDINSLIESNILFGTQLVEAMIQNGINSLINTGTSWQHYNNEIYNPVCLYAATKQAFEDILKFYAEVNNLKVINLKLFDTYGPGDFRNKLFTLLNNAAKNHELLKMSPGEQFLDLVYIDDVVNAFLVAADRISKMKDGTIESFAVSSGKRIKLKDVVRLYSEITKQEIQIDWGGRPYRKREVMVPWENGTKLPGWCPSVDLEEGMKKIYNHEFINHE